jgi:hypothetical protein
MFVQKSRIDVIAATVPPIANPGFFHDLWRGVSTGWARWMNPACPDCGTARSCPECLIENNP